MKSQNCESTVVPIRDAIHSFADRGGPMCETNLKMVAGEVLVPDVPGMGMAVRDDYIKKHRVA